MINRFTLIQQTAKQARGIIKPWDVAATDLLITEEGGFIKNIDGRNLDITIDQRVAGNSTLVNQFLKKIK